MLLNSFALDVSSLSQPGFDFIQNVLRRPQFGASSFRLLLFGTQNWLISPHHFRSVNRSTLKTLTYSGDKLDAWILFWMMTFNNKVFLSVDLHSLSTRGGPHELLHASALCIHQLLYVGSLESHMENVHWQEEHDWRLITSAVNTSAGRPLT
ncbi:MAG: hypothetical protein BYD32DRAFT_467403 [Podila humilis]|nr:MAG: hypothetical protein BYD32DRAFT_467403 [Podila humilis]